MSIDIQELKEMIENEESSLAGQDFVRKWAFHSGIGADKIGKVIKDLSDEELAEWAEKFFAWESKWEECQYKKGKETSSLLFNCVYGWVSREGNQVNNTEWEDFLVSEDEWRGYHFKLYQGQGSFVRVIKDNKIIF